MYNQDFTWAVERIGEADEPSCRRRRTDFWWGIVLCVMSSLISVSFGRDPADWLRSMGLYISITLGQMCENASHPSCELTTNSMNAIEIRNAEITYRTSVFDLERRSGSTLISIPVASWVPIT